MVSKVGKDSFGGYSLTPLQMTASSTSSRLVLRTVDLIGQTNSKGYNRLHFAAMYSKKDVNNCNHNTRFRSTFDCFYRIVMDENKTFFN